MGNLKSETKWNDLVMFEIFGVAVLAKGVFLFDRIGFYFLLFICIKVILKKSESGKGEQKKAKKNEIFVWTRSPHFNTSTLTNTSSISYSSAHSRGWLNFRGGCSRSYIINGLEKTPEHHLSIPFEGFNSNFQIIAIFVKSRRGSPRDQTG